MARKQTTGLYLRNGIWHIDKIFPSAHPLSWEEQSLLFAELPDHLTRMVLYKVNSGSLERKWSSFAGIGKSRYRSSEPAFSSFLPISAGGTITRA